MQRTQLSDLALMQQIAAGDGEVFACLYQSYVPRLAGYLQSLLGQPELVDDVLHDVLLRVWQYAGQFRGEAQLFTWMCRIARQQVHKTLRTRQGALPRSAFLETCDREDPETVWTRQERVQTVAHALATLPLHERTVLKWAYAEDCSLQEMAGRLGCSVYTVRSRLHQAQRHLAVAVQRVEKNSRVRS